MRPTLQRKRDFERVYSRGRKFSCPAVVVFHLASAPDHKVAFVASRKVGNAVERNRAKRVMRAAFAALDSPRTPIPGWLVLVARREILRFKSTDVCAQLSRLLVGGFAGPRDIPDAPDPATGSGP
jgi:ribonuclease P protein component